MVGGGIGWDGGGGIGWDGGIVGLGGEVGEG